SVQAENQYGTANSIQAGKRQKTPPEKMAKLLLRNTGMTDTFILLTKMEIKYQMVLTTSIRTKLNMKSEIWIGLADVVPLPGCKRLGTGKGAFVKVALWANSDSDFCSKVARAISDLDLKLLELEDREPIVNRLIHSKVGEETLLIAETAKMNPNDAVFG